MWKLFTKVLASLNRFYVKREMESLLKIIGECDCDECKAARELDNKKILN